MKQVHILIADHNQLASGLLAEALAREGGIIVAGRSSDHGSLLRMAQSLQPDVALVSATIPGGPLRTGNSAETPPSLSCPWVALLDDDDPTLVVACFRAGASGVFPRSQPDIQQLAKCLRRVAEGQIWADTQQLRYLLDALAASSKGNASPAGSPPKLTRREESVIRLVVQGMVNREIAEKLGLSEHTVKNYLFRIFDKLGVSNRVELALYAVARLQVEAHAA